MKKASFFISIIALLTSISSYYLRQPTADSRQPTADSRQPTADSYVYARLNFPATHENILFGRTWDIPVKHDENKPVDCAETIAKNSSQCIVTIKISNDILKQGVTHILLRVKAKTWIPNGKDTSVKNYSLIYGSLVNPDIKGLNHFFHCETFGSGPDYQGESRRVTFTTLIVPIVNDEIKIKVGKKITGRGVVEIAVYEEGFLRAENVKNLALEMEHTSN